MTQISKHGQPVHLSLLLSNGQDAQLGLYVRNLLTGQDWQAWQADLEGFKRWLAECVGQYIRNLDVQIRTQDFRVIPGGGPTMPENYSNE